MSRLKCPPSLQTLVSQRLEDLIRKAADKAKDPGCHELCALTEGQKAKAQPLAEFVRQIPGSTATEMLHRVLEYQGEGQRKASPMDVWILMHPSGRRLVYSRDPEGHKKRHPLPNVHKALLETVHRCRYLDTLDLSGMDDHATTPDYNDLRHSTDCREHFLHVLEDALHQLANLCSLNLGTLATNGMCKAISQNCPRLRELRMCGPCQVTDLGLRYIAGQVPNVGGQRKDNHQIGTDTEDEAPPITPPGCFQLQILSIKDVEHLSLSTLTMLMLHLPQLRLLDHNSLHEALWLMQKTGTLPEGSLGLTGYNGRGPSQCEPKYLDALRHLCPKMQNIHLCTTFEDTFLSLAHYRHVSTLSIYRVSCIDTLDLPLMAFGATLTKLELRNCTSFSSGAALHIRKYCGNLRCLVLDIDSVEANNAGQPGQGVADILREDGHAQQQNVWSLQHQVHDLQARLNHLQLTMLNVMDKYGPMAQLEELHLRNLSMGSLLILLPFAPNLRVLTMKYSLRETPESAPNLTDELFQKIFKKNLFQDLEHLIIWCKTLTGQTADWFLKNCGQLRTLKNLSFWNMADEEQVRLWREGRYRQPIGVDVDF